MTFSERTSGNTEDFLSFEPTERPKWREATISGNIDAIPPVSEMVRNIMQYRKRYLELKTPEGKSTRKKVLRDLLGKFLCNVQKEENIGVKMQGKTEEIMKELDSEPCNSRTKRRMEDDGNPIKKRQHSDPPEKMSPQQESPEFESYPSLEEDLSDIHQGIASSGHDLKPSKSETETKNLYKAYKHIVDELNKTQSDLSTDCPSTNAIDDFKGVIDLDALIIHTHRILMEDVMQKDQIPGRFSINKREANFKGKLYEYPLFQDETVADKAVQTLVDKANVMMDDIKHKPVAEEERLKLYFKCASIFLFVFLTLHPFPDGNGRLARLLASYNLLTFSPFMTPIYNVFSSSRECDYVQALIDARANLEIPERISYEADAVILTIGIMHQKPADLCAMLIESNWTMWRQLLVRLGDESIKLFDWELENQESLKKTFEIAEKNLYVRTEFTQSSN